MKIAITKDEISAMPAKKVKKMAIAYTKELLSHEPKEVAVDVDNIELLGNLDVEYCTKLARANYKYFNKKWRNDVVLEDCIRFYLKGDELPKSMNKYKIYRKNFDYVAECFGTDDESILSKVENDEGVYLCRGVVKEAKRVAKKYAKLVDLEDLPHTESSREEVLQEIEKLKHVKAKHKLLLSTIQWWIFPK